MSAIALSHPVAERRPGYGRLIAVELRKMVDTRAGFWLSAGVVATTAVVAMIAMLTGPAGIHSLERTLRFALQPSAFLLPVTGILLVTGEFSQRTAMTTFALVPSRSRVLGAKLGAALLLSAPAIVAYLLLPTVWSALAGSIHALSGVARWLDQSETLAPMARHPLSATEWTHALATLAVWMVLPLAVGGWRLMRRDVG